MKSIAIENGNACEFRIVVTDGYTLGDVIVGDSTTPLVAGDNGIYTISNVTAELAVTVNVTKNEVPDTVWTFDKQTSTSDSTSDLTDTTFGDIFNSTGLTFVSCSKAYQGANGTIKFSSSKANGNITFKVTEKRTAIKLIFNAKTWVGSTGTADTSSFKVTVADKDGNEIKTLSSGNLTTSDTDYTLTFDSEVNLENCTITVEATKRMYLTSITASSK